LHAKHWLATQNPVKHITPTPLLQLLLLLLLLLKLLP
jgi:hypothetical protein